MTEKHVPNFEAPMMCVQLIPQQCRDCAFRYKKYVMMGDRKIECPEDFSWKKGSCFAFKYPKHKPSGVMSNTEYCSLYEKDSD